MRAALACLAILVLASAPAGADSMAEPVQKTITTHKGKLKACFQREMERDPSVAAGGKVVVEFRINKDGTPTRVRIGRKSTLRHDSLERCLLGVFRAMRFPRVDEVTDVSFPLVFSGG